MKERTIAFNGAMIRAILAGQKTQTRRVIKPQPKVTEQRLREMGAWTDGFTLSQHVDTAWQHGFIDVDCPYGQPGDRLWVREAWRLPSIFKAPTCCLYAHKLALHAADGRNNPASRRQNTMLMPLWATRILLEIVSVRVERLQSISEAAAEAEGITTAECLECDGWVNAYSRLWESINGEGSWAANPWVWVVEFKRIEATP